MQLGSNHPAPVIPHIEENTTYYDAGPVRFGFEKGRALNAEIVGSHLAMHSDVLEQLSDDELDGFDDGGPSVHVFVAETGFEVLRFDLFRRDPHYHYLYPEHVILVAYDVNASGPMFDWVMQSLRHRLPQMLRFVEQPELAEQIDAEAVERALGQLEHESGVIPEPVA